MALGSFWKNPQFQLVLTVRDQPDDDEEEEDEDWEEEEEEESDGSDSDEMTPEERRAEEKRQKSKRCTVVVELLQKNRRRRGKVHFLHIAFHVYKVSPQPLLTLTTPPCCLPPDSHLRLCHPFFCRFLLT